MQLQSRTAAVQVALRQDLPRPVVATLRLNTNAWKLAADRIFAGGDINARMDADLQIRRKIDDDVTNSSVKRGIAELAVHGHELCGDTTSAGFRAHAVRNFEAVNAAAAGLCFDGAGAASGQANAATAGFHVHGSGYAAYFDIPAAG